MEDWFVIKTIPDEKLATEKEIRTYQALYELCFSNALNFFIEYCLPRYKNSINRINKQLPSALSHFFLELISFCLAKE